MFFGTIEKLKILYRTLSNSRGLSLTPAPDYTSVVRLRDVYKVRHVLETIYKMSYMTFNNYIIL